VICNAWDVIVVPFPFVDSPKTKRRPALVISRKDFNRHGHTICAMITTKHQPAWPGDVPITDLNSAGLPRACIVRPKLFTLDNRLLAERQ
jgi:mRNA interferase MazF